MKKTPEKLAPKAYQEAQGNFHTRCPLPLRKESDLAIAYYPGINGVLKKIESKPTNQAKYDRLHCTVAVVSTLPATLYAVLTAKAGILSQVGELNALPLLLDPDQPTQHAETLRRLEQNFIAIFCVGMSRKEVEILRATYDGQLPILVDQELEAAAVTAAVMNSAKLLKKSLKKVRVTVEGESDLTLTVVEALINHGVEQITLVDDRGALYRKRPNMNRQKNALVEVTTAKKDERSREEIYSETDIYINGDDETLSDKKAQNLQDKAVLITLKAEAIKAGKRQACISTLPDHCNHLTDLHLAAGICQSLIDGKTYTEKTLNQAIKGLHEVYKAPKKERLFPGLLEKNLAAKIAKAIK